MSFLLLGLIAGLAAVERKGFLQAMLSRPIALAPVAGLALGDAAGGLAVAAPLELFWLGAVNLGAALPVHEALGTTAIAGGAVLAGRALGTGVTPPVAVLAVLLCAPLALLGRKTDRIVEIENERLALRAEEELACHRARTAVRLNLAGLALPFAIAGVLAPIGAALCGAAVPVLLRDAPSLEAPLALAWWAFTGVACAAGAKALRARRAGWAFAAAAGLVLALQLVLGGRA
ncbi:MAG TPA: PTS sugar transporter subunit IIC [Anaeromyxobacteraceae bacterium]|nr:PTS sugar transporter subunit IIC [Anaeromyxobacteraceae bacterium]